MTPNTHELERYLATGRMLCEIGKDYGISVEEAANLIKSLKDGQEFDIYPTVNSEGKRIFIARRKPVIVAPEPKIWKSITASDEDGNPQPYIIILMPDDVDWRKIKIYFLGDMHFGSRSFDAKALDAYLKLISGKPYAFIIGIGDWVENALGGSVGGAVYDQIMNPDEQLLGVRELLRPVAHKILCAIPGNHEWRSFIMANAEILKYAVCEHLGILYFNEPIHIDILWRGKIFPFYAQHGASNSQTKGGKLNAASRPLGANEFTMFTGMAHVHDPMSGKNIKRCVEFIRDEDGNIIDLKIVWRTEHVVICPAFYKPWGNYGARAGYNPVSRGFVQACVIEPNGHYYVDKKPLIISGR